MTGHPHDRVSGPEYPPAWDLEPAVDVRSEQHACPGCGSLFWFCGIDPDEHWRCRHCVETYENAMDELGSHMAEMENTDGPR